MPIPSGREPRILRRPFGMKSTSIPSPEPVPGSLAYRSNLTGRSFRRLVRISRLPVRPTRLTPSETSRDRDRGASRRRSLNRLEPYRKTPRASSPGSLPVRPSRSARREEIYPEDATGVYPRPPIGRTRRARKGSRVHARAVPLPTSPRGVRPYLCPPARAITARASAIAARPPARHRRPRAIGGAPGPAPHAPPRAASITRPIARTQRAYTQARALCAHAGALAHTRDHARIRSATRTRTRARR